MLSGQESQCKQTTLLAPCPPVSSVRDELPGALPKFKVAGICHFVMRRKRRRHRTRGNEALANSFTPGSKMAGWLCTILRNEFYSEYRRRRHEAQDEDGYHAAKMESQPAQEGHMQFLEFRDALDRSPPEQREALILVGTSGFSYQDAPGFACAVGTMKSRVSRARVRLSAILAVPEQYRGSNTARPHTPTPANDHAVAPRISTCSVTPSLTAATTLADTAGTNGPAAAQRRPPVSPAPEATSIRSSS